MRAWVAPASPPLLSKGNLGVGYGFAYNHAASWSGKLHEGSSCVPRGLEEVDRVFWGCRCRVLWTDLQGPESAPGKALLVELTKDLMKEKLVRPLLSGSNHPVVQSC